MRSITEHYVVMDCPYDCSIPKMYFSKSTPPFWDIDKSVNLYDYLKDYVFQCTQGDTNDTVKQGAKDAARKLFIKTNVPRPTLTSKPKGNQPNKKPRRKM